MTHYDIYDARIRAEKALKSAQEDLIQAEKAYINLPDEVEDEIFDEVHGRLDEAETVVDAYEKIISALKGLEDQVEYLESVGRSVL